MCFDRGGMTGLRVTPQFGFVSQKCIMSGLYLKINNIPKVAVARVSAHRT